MSKPDARMYERMLPIAAAAAVILLTGCGGGAHKTTPDFGAPLQQFCDNAQNDVETRQAGGTASFYDAKTDARILAGCQKAGEKGSVPG